MPPRQSARVAGNRDPASSPPMKSGQRVAKPSSSAIRTSRATRSQSRDLDDKDASKSTRKGARPRAARQGSVDSVGSNTSVDSRGVGKRKQTRAAVAIGDLSAVAEEQERENPAEGEPTNTNTNDNGKVFQSPGAMSNLSGTTALTTQSVQKMADLDTGMIVEVIPDLSRESFRLLELLTPANASPEDTDALVKELHVPGSGRGKRLRLREKAFDNAKENYTTETFIDPTLILRKLFNDEQPEFGDFRPDPILYAANNAILIKELLVAQRDNPNTMELLQDLDDIFPTPFLPRFGTEPHFGSSALHQATSDLALEIRTQTVIAIVKAYRDEANYDPDQLLAQVFYEPPERRDEAISSYEDSLQNGRYRRVAGITFDTTPLEGERLGDSFSKQIHQRVEAIREGFRLDKENINNGDYVDFDFLDDHFPWNNFLGNVVQWSQLRMEEVNKDIQRQGGVENITALLADKIKSVDSQIELFYEPSKASQPAPQATKAKPSLLPAATIIPASAGKSLYTSSKILNSLPKKRAPLSPAPPSNQQQAGVLFGGNHATKPTADPKTPLRQGPTRNSRASAPQRLTDLAYGLEQDNEVESDDAGADSKSQMLAHFYDGERYDHKENTPVTGGEIRRVEKPRFVDPQPNAQRVAWSPSQQSEDSEAGRQTRGGKRKHQAVEIEEDEDDEEDEEEAFEEDPRTVDLSRRSHVVRPAEETWRPITSTQSNRQAPSRRQSVQEQEDAEIAAALRRREKRRRLEQDQDQELEQEQEREEDLQDRALQASAEAADERPQSTPYEKINETAKARKTTNMRHVVQTAPRGRQPWSADETELLIILIGRMGSHWADILREGKHGFSDIRDQVSLKDKARNIKVDYLLAGTALPLNFNAVALGKKERDRVKAAGMNPYRLEGEEVGYESYDMEGNMIASE